MNVMDFKGRMEEVVGKILRDDVTVAQVSGGLTFWLLRDPSVEEGFHMNPPPPDWEGLSEEALGFVARQRRPPEYPADVPFLERSAAIVNPTAAGLAVLWMSCPNPLLGFREILDQSRASGWEGPSGEDVPLATQEDREADLRKSGRVRSVCLRIIGSAGAWYLTLRDQVAVQ